VVPQSSISEGSESNSYGCDAIHPPQPPLRCCRRCE